MLEPLTLTKLDCYITVKIQTCLTTRDLGGQYESSLSARKLCYLGSTSPVVKHLFLLVIYLLSMEGKRQ
jgi:hypothetical protein